MSDNANITYQNLWFAAKAALRGKFIALKEHILENQKGWKFNSVTIPRS
jgi:hypothetical protein